MLLNERAGDRSQRVLQSNSWDCRLGRNRAESSWKSRRIVTLSCYYYLGGVIETAITIRIKAPPERPAKQNERSPSDV
jgi:hypothetical protein